jgi:hypothetical protein
VIICDSEVIYHQKIKYILTRLSSREGTAYIHRAPAFILVFCGVSVTESLAFSVLLLRSLCPFSFDLCSFFKNPPDNSLTGEQAPINKLYYKENLPIPHPQIIQGIMQNPSTNYTRDYAEPSASYCTRNNIS